MSISTDSSSKTAPLSSLPVQETFDCLNRPETPLSKKPAGVPPDYLLITKETIARVGRECKAKMNRDTKFFETLILITSIVLAIFTASLFNPYLPPPGRVLVAASVYLIVDAILNLIVENFRNRSTEDAVNALNTPAFRHFLQERGIAVASDTLAEAHEAFKKQELEKIRRPALKQN